MSTFPDRRTLPPARARAIKTVRNTLTDLVFDGVLEVVKAPIGSRGWRGKARILALYRFTREHLEVAQ